MFHIFTPSVLFVIFKPVVVRCVHHIVTLRNLMDLRRVSKHLSPLSSDSLFGPLQTTLINVFQTESFMLVDPVFVM